MKKQFILLGLGFLCLFSSVYAQNRNVTIEGELKKWHKVTLKFSGDELSENDANNPFLNYRLNVTFKSGNTKITVPGYYAADGDAGNTGSDRGKIWKVHFTPNKIGTWFYEVSFRRGPGIAVSDNPTEGDPLLFNNLKGKINITASDKSGDDFRAKGRLKYVGKNYLQFEGSKDYFLKGGAGSPENFLGYYEFDQTPPSHKYQPHAKEWKYGDPTWGNGKGKNIIGSLNYLASKGMNSVYFLTMNVQGDGKDVWPWNNLNERYRFDCSKLDQWEVVFEHMDKLGIVMHIITQETENELLLDIGQVGVQRKLYYRELIARFSHHLAITWNLGEENGAVYWSPKAQNNKDRKAMAKYLKEHDPYQNFVVLHTHALPEEQDLYLEPMLGYTYLDGPSLQTKDPDKVHDIVKKWVEESQKHGRNWVVCQDEIGPANAGAIPDADDPDHDTTRHEVLWGTFMAGGAGLDWYFGYKYAHNDLKCEDWHSRDILWDQTRYALDFFQKYTPFYKMHAADGLTENTKDYVFTDNGKTYVVYLPKVVETKLNLEAFDKECYAVKWYNPRTGGKLQKGSKSTVKGGKIVSIGLPPNSDKDWVALLTLKNTEPSKKSHEKSEVIVLKSSKDFEIDTSSKAVYYQEHAKGALAIDATNKAYRNVFARAKTVFKGKSGLYNAKFTTMTENDGESEYQIAINGSVVFDLTNPVTDKSFEVVYHDLEKIYLHENDLIEISSKAVTNGKIPEGDETAWSRGRWNSLKLVQDGYEEALKNNKPAFVEKNGFLEVEAENFHSKTNNGTKRDWYIRSEDAKIPFKKNIQNHTSGASGKSYIEALPDTRITHDDPLISDVNFFPVQGSGGIVSYKIEITNPGTYHVWARAFSTGTEDNGVHVGVNGEWPESSARMQWCDGKNKWTWSSAQRVPENHCGEPNTISLNFIKAGIYTISFSMREDGFELDKWILTKDSNFKPE